MAQMLALTHGALPFYPPAGVALAALLIGGWRYLPAVALGIALGMAAGFAPHPGALWHSAALAVVLSGAQVGLAFCVLHSPGGWKLRSAVALGAGATHFFIRRWLLASAVAAPLGAWAHSLAAFSSGLIHPDFFAYTYWVSAAGNFLGMWLVAPALLALQRAPVSWKNQVRVVALPMFLGLMAVLYFWHRTEHSEQMQWREKTQSQLEEFRQSLNTQLHMTQTALTATQAWVLDNPHISQATLVSFSHAFMHELPGLKTLEWQAASSMPNTHTSPPLQPQRWLVIRRPLVQQNLLRGELLAWLDIKEFLQGHHTQPAVRDWAIRVDDISDGETQPLFSFPDETTASSPSLWAPAYAAQSTFEVPGRRWLIRFIPSHAFLAQQRSAASGWALLMGTLALAGLQIFLWTLAGHAAAVEAQVQKRTQELRNSQAKLHRMLESPLVGISLWNEAGDIYEANDAFLRLIGYRRDELQKRAIGILDITPKKLHAQDIERRARIVQGEALEPFEKEYVHRDGHLIPVMISAHLFDDGQSGVSFVFDISKQKHIQEQLRRLNLTLEQRVELELEKNREKDLLLLQQARLAAIGEMIGNIAHQWRQPLTTLSLLLENIRDAHYFGELNTASMDSLANTGQALVQKMSGTIDDFRNFFRLDRQKQIFGLQQCVERTLQLVSAAYQACDIEARIYVDQDVQVLGFENEYSQVLLNLFTNARDAIRDRQPHGGVVTVVIEKRGDDGAIIVADNGGGIPSLLLEKIFDPYFTTREQGTGIGLYMSKMIIENNMSGRIEARNAGGGAEFTVLVPAAALGNTTHLEQEVSKLDELHAAAG